MSGDCRHPNHGGWDHACAPFVVSGDQLNLDAIEEMARMAEPDPYCLPADAATVLALVAEVRRLRAEHARAVSWLGLPNVVIRKGAVDEPAAELDAQ